MTSSRQAILPPPPPPSIRLHWFLCTSWCALRAAVAQGFQQLARRWRALRAPTPAPSSYDRKLSELRLLPLQRFIPGVVAPLTVPLVPALAAGHMTIEGVMHLRPSAPTTVQRRVAPARAVRAAGIAGRP